eukprot:CAMPEP_0172528504 /NCGR_PEP_ID=MMETSP1067-20121228/2876_1 /TAXON_ID=265564 ORGANISM="Thalassiosira punctigera, Strain Tpunct2005C2" /NCGR_SAMPLE_ID=MMETSP1067 /ASSEMBLY_ACC=CAM_ASM_000444 /LENGTH=813 /DNA_ID=CAMNT_0013312425 /DNA_START=518 /DNA_END=2959 /DNA_ORIENTATION=+
MQYVALTYLSAPVIQVLIQSKLVTTAILSVLVLGRTYSSQQWTALMVLSLGVAIVIIDEEGGAEMRRLSGDVNADNTVRGILAVAIACIVSSLAGVYFEKVLKQNQQGPQPSLWLRNMLLSLFSIIVALSQSLLHDNSARRHGSFVYKPFFHGFAPLVWLQVFLLSCGGILVAAVMKYTDNVIKGLATGISVVVSALMSAVFLGTVISTPFLYGAGMILFAVMFFFDSHLLRIPWTTLIWLIQDCVISRAPPMHRNKCILPLCVICLASFSAHMSRTSSFVHLAEINTSSMRAGLAYASDLMNHTLQLANSNESLNSLLRLMEEDFYSTQIIYGIRTFLGDRPATYLEIGSYKGAAFMLKHPFPTYVIGGSDFCDLSLKDMQRRNNAILKKFSSLGQHGCALSSMWKLSLGCPPDILPEDTYDIIYISGNNLTIGVWSEFNYTMKYVRPGGFIVDDLDVFHDARTALESSTQATDMVGMGRTRSKANIFQKRGHFEPEPLPVPTAPVMCVVVYTFRRRDGSTPRILEGMWKMLLNQSYLNWKLYLTGYDFQEWRALSFVNDSRVDIDDLPQLGVKLKDGSLWVNAGLAAANEGIRRALLDGHQWIVRLDDDDFWDADHLENIYAGVQTGATFVTTSCQYRNGGYLPPETNGWGSHIRHDVPPRPCKTIHSSVAFNAGMLRSRYETQLDAAADAYMWARVLFEDKFLPAFVPGMSCYQNSEVGQISPVRIVRKSMLDDILPNGWYRDNEAESFNDYNTLASYDFELEISQHCVFVVGPEKGHPNFHLLKREDVPYHIRKVHQFSNMSVWKAKQT